MRMRALQMLPRRCRAYLFARYGPSSGASRTANSAQRAGSAPGRAKPTVFVPRRLDFALGGTATISYENISRMIIPMCYHMIKNQGGAVTDASDCTKRVYAGWQYSAQRLLK